MGGGEHHNHTNTHTPTETHREHDFSGHHLLLAWPASASSSTEKFATRIRARYPKLTVSSVDPGKGKEITKEQWSRTSILSTFGTFPSSPDFVPRMEFLHLLSAGSNHMVSHPLYTDSSIVLTTSSGIHGPAISEWVVLTLLSHAHRFPLLLGWQERKFWPPGASEERRGLDGVADYAGQKMAVLGYGSIGRQVGRVARAMGMAVLAYTASKKAEGEARRDHGFVVPGTGDVEGSIPEAWFWGLEKEKLHEFLRQEFDVLVVCVPLTKETEGLLGEEEFKILGRKGGRCPFVVNIARGKIVVSSALIKALEAYKETSGRGHADGDRHAVEGIRGAALDVTDPEPLDGGNALWNAPNLFISPHVSGSSVAYLDRAALVLEGNLERFRRGETLWNVVDRERGY